LITADSVELRASSRTARSCRSSSSTIVLWPWCFRMSSTQGRRDGAADTRAGRHERLEGGHAGKWPQDHGATLHCARRDDPRRCRARDLCRTGSQEIGFVKDVPAMLKTKPAKEVVIRMPNARPQPHREDDLREGRQHSGRHRMGRRCTGCHSPHHRRQRARPGCVESAEV
jgi:hypothetical protein